ncbi:MAG: DUF1501 domain-containing protein [Pirellulaceae bacterium]
MHAAFHRREVLRIGGLSLFAGMTGLGNAGWTNQPLASSHRKCIFIMLQGGPSHIDLWDPKPRAPSEVRGPFRTIRTNLPGVEFGELVSQSAQIADRLTVIRSMTHKFTNHIAGTYITLTGSDNQPDRDREAHSDDFPGPGAVLNYLHPEPPKVPLSVSLPNWLSIPGPSNRMPGQYAGFLGSNHNPLLVEGDPNAQDYNPLSLGLTDGMTRHRLDDRLNLLKQLDRTAHQLEQELNESHDRLRECAFDLVVDGRVREALDVSREPATVRDAYGRNKMGQSLLVARRLIEAGVRYVAYNEFNQAWDTHGGLDGRYRDIVPKMDQAFAALVRDLEERGLLDETLVVNTGEFGRTPVINDLAGRDHWPNVYSTVLAGGGIQRGLILGASDWKGGEVADRPVAPADVLATLWNQLGIDPQTTMRDRLNRPFPVSNGTVIRDILSS